MKQVKILVCVMVALSLSPFSFKAPQTTNALVGWAGAAGSPYVGSAATQPMDINVSRDNNDSTDRWNRYFKIDKNGYPHIVWVEYGTYKINYVRWNGTKWVNANNIEYNPTLINATIDNNGDCPELVLDKNDRPNIVFHSYRGTSDKIIYIKWDGLNWVDSTGIIYNGNNAIISNSLFDSVDPVIALDNNDNPHIVWLDDTNDKINYAYFEMNRWKNAYGLDFDSTQNNGIVSLGNGECHFPFIAIDSTNQVGITWEMSLNSNYDIHYIKVFNNNLYNANNNLYDGINSNISNDVYPNINQQSKITFDSKGNPNIIWQEYDDIYYIKWSNNKWLTINDSPYLPNSGNANISNTPGISICAAIQLDSHNYPHIAWSDNTLGNYEIFYFKWDGTKWITSQNEIYIPSSGNADISQNIGNSINPYLELNSNNNPNLLWTDNSVGNNEIYYVKFTNSFDGTFNITKSVDTNNDGDYSDSGKNVNAGDTLKYKINWKFNQGQDQLENPYLYDTVPDGTTYVVGSASPNANISYSLDGGNTWIAGEPPNGSPAGTQLRWDLSSLWVGAAGSPYIPNQASYPSDIASSPNVGPVGTNYSIALDLMDYPHIVWADTSFSANSEVFYVHWDGSNWVGTDGTLFNPLSAVQPPSINVSRNNGTSGGAHIEIDKGNNPHISWTDTTYANCLLMYVHWNGSNWVGANGSVYDPSSAIQPMDINILRKSNAIGNGGNRFRLDSFSRPHFILPYQDNGWDVYYLKWNGLDWVGANGTPYNPVLANQPTDINVSSRPGWDNGPDMVLDKNDNPHVVFHGNWNPTGWDVIYLKWGGSGWIGANGSIYNPGTFALPTDINVSSRSDRPDDRNAHIRVDSKGNPNIIWDNFSDPTNFNVLFVKWSNGSWVGANGSVYNPAAAFASLPFDINVTRNTSAVLRTQIDGVFDDRLQLDSKDNPYIVWDDGRFGNTDGVFVKWNGSDWVGASGSVYIPNASPQPLDINFDRSNSATNVSNLRLDSKDQPHIIFSNTTAGNQLVFYIEINQFNKSFTFSVKVDNPATYYGICNSAVFRHKWDNGVPTTSNEVCNTITYNFTGIFTLDKGVDANSDGNYSDNGATVAVGTKLSYKLDWTFTNPNNDPLTAAYVYDTVPLGTKYVSGSAPTFNLSYSTDNGFTWHPGEPPDGSAAGTKLRWKIRQPGWTNAQGQLVNSTNPNMTKNTGISDFPSLAINKNCDPCIAWSDDTSGTTMAYYARWDGTQWVNAAGVAFTVANGSVGNIPGGDPSLALDPVTGYPWVAIQSNAILFSNLEIHIIKWNGTQWTNAAGAPVTLLNSDVSNNAGLSWFPSQLVLDSHGYPCIVWKDNTTGTMQNYFARWNGTNWTNAAGAVLNTTNASMNNNVVNSFWPTISLDFNDRPYVAWDNNPGTNFEIYFAKWDGTQWVTASGAALTPTNGNVSNNTGSSQIPFLFTDRITGNPCLAWSDDTPGNYEIYYAKWNGTAWVNASGTVLDPTNANMSHTTGGSYLLSLALDFNNLPAISWEDDTTGNSEIYYGKWNGSVWVNAAGVAFTAANGIINTSPARSWFPSLAFDPVTGNPNIAWLDKTPGNNEVYFGRWTDFHQTFTFSVKVDNPFTVAALSPICNSATFSHAFDDGLALSSNDVCVKVKGGSVVKGANLVVKKTAKSMEYYPTDTFEFRITVTNNGSGTAENVTLVDNFPREISFVSAVPSGNVGQNSVRFALGNLNPNQSSTYTLKFKLADKIEIADCITVINEAVAVSGTVVAKDSAIIRICQHIAPDPLWFMVKWSGLAGNEGKTGTAIVANIKPVDGASPYEITTDWGDGSKSTGVVKDANSELALEHTYQTAGEYTITITCRDRYLQTRFLTKTITIR